MKARERKFKIQNYSIVLEPKSRWRKNFLPNPDNVQLDASMKGNPWNEITLGGKCLSLSSLNPKALRLLWNPSFTDVPRTKIKLLCFRFSSIIFRIINEASLTFRASARIISNGYAFTWAKLHIENSINYLISFSSPNNTDRTTCVFRPQVLDN